MNVFGLHTFAIAPVWDLSRIEPQIERLKEFGIGLLEIPLLRPEEIDVKRSRAFANRHGVELLCSLGLPRALDVVERPDEALDFLAQRNRDTPIRHRSMRAALDHSWNLLSNDERRALAWTPE